MTEKFDLSKFFLPYQKNWINDKSQYKIWEKSRQIGASYATAYEDVEDCLIDPHIPACWIGSKNLSTAKEYIEYCQYWANVYAGIYLKIENELLDGQSVISVKFKNGKKITAMASTPDGMRGKRGKINLDEFDFHADQDNLYKVAFAMTTWGYPLRIFSTISEVENTRYKKLIEEIKAGVLPDWSHHYTTIYDAVEQGLADKIAQMKLKGEDRKDFLGLTDDERQEFIQKIKKNCLTQENFDQEYCCIRIDASTKFITYNMIEDCSKTGLCKIENIENINDLEKLDKSKLHQWMEYIEENTYLGIDVATTKHLTVLWFLKKETNLRTIFILCLKNWHLTPQEKLIDFFLQNKKIKRCSQDATGIGKQMGQALEKKYGSYRYEGVTFTNEIKANFAFQIYKQMQDQSIIIPKDDLIIADLRSIKKTTTATGKPLFDSEGNKESHADRFWALGLAIYASDNEQKPLSQSITSRNTRKAKDLLHGY